MDSRLLNGEREGGSICEAIHLSSVAAVITVFSHGLSCQVHDGTRSLCRQTRVNETWWKATVLWWVFSDISTSPDDFCVCNKYLYVEWNIKHWLVVYLFVCGADCQCPSLLEGESRSDSPRYAMCLQLNKSREWTLTPPGECRSTDALSWKMMLMSWVK